MGTLEYESDTHVTDVVRVVTGQVEFGPKWRAAAARNEQQAIVIWYTHTPLLVSWSSRDITAAVDGFISSSKSCASPTSVTSSIVTRFSEPGINFYSSRRRHTATSTSHRIRHFTTTIKRKFIHSGIVYTHGTFCAISLRFLVAHENNRQQNLQSVNKN